MDFGEHEKQVGTLRCLQNTQVRGRPFYAQVFMRVRNWGHADAANRFNDDEAVFVVVAVMSLAAGLVCAAAVVVSGDNAC